MTTRHTVGAGDTAEQGEVLLKQPPLHVTGESCPCAPCPLQGPPLKVLFVLYVCFFLSPITFLGIVGNRNGIDCSPLSEDP